MCDVFIQKVIDNLNNIDFGYYVHHLSCREMDDLLGEQIIKRTKHDLEYENIHMLQLIFSKRNGHVYVLK